MKIKLLHFIIFIICNTNIQGQNTSEINSELKKLFYNLPIDSCIGYIEQQITDTSTFRIIKKNSTYIFSNSKFLTYKILRKEDAKADSLLLDLNYEGIPVGDVQGQVSPIEYEQWLKKTFYFGDFANANDFFIRMRNLMDTLPHNYDPYLNKKNKVIEWIYNVNMINTKDIQNRIVHLNFYTEKNKVEFIYRLIYTYNKCECNKQNKK
jgi:hypothetical protein